MLLRKSFDKKISVRKKGNSKKKPKDRDATNREPSLRKEAPLKTSGR